MGLDDLGEYLQKAVQENPALDYVPPRRSIQDYAMLVKTRYRGSRTEYQEDSAIQEGGTGLEELQQQLRLSGFSPQVKAVAEQMLPLLSPRGYFTQTVSGFAREAGIPLELARSALDAVQSLDPPGIGARTVAECLELQLRGRGELDPLVYDLVRMYLLEIGRGSLRQIARETGASLAHVQKCVEIIRRLTPAPCSLHEEKAQYILPELSVEVGEDGQLSILFHNDYYPSVRRDVTFDRLTASLTGEEQQFARRMQRTADQLIHALEMRQVTMEKMAGVIVSTQKSFFLGEYSLLPLRIDETARQIGVHESTVYRAIQNKYLYCSRGTFPLSHFFQKEVSGGTSAARVKEIIREICRREGKVSDRVIAEALEKRGIALSRRTVAKYRAQMEIDSSFHRTADGKE